LESFIVASIGDWNRKLFEENSKEINGKWFFIDNPEQLDEVLIEFHPRYIFFPHWRWIVPEKVLNKYECICFHMTDVPYGRGGSPLQNLILRGHKDTILSALRMEKGLDTGPVYMKYPLSLEGTAQEIYLRTSNLVWRMIEKFIISNPIPTPQVGEPVTFKRRKPNESELPIDTNFEKIYDFIRMLDADGYPNAFINYGEFQIRFNSARLSDGKLVANAEFILRENP
jgi:methionyl-tRNA formyltransferase